MQDMSSTKLVLLLHQQTVCGSMFSAHPCGAKDWGTIEPSARLVAERLMLVLFKY